ncbi:MAG: hypothetical protein ACR2P0_18975 [Acidimicrobiales bacterium]
MTPETMSLDQEDSGADLATDSGRRLSPMAIAGLVVLALAAFAISAVVVSLETHFDCGGTFGGFGASATSDIDQSCVDGRLWRIPVVWLVIVATSTFAGVTIGRPDAGSRLSRTVRTLTVLAGLIALWAVSLTTLVKT